jgi:hypothetical protein
MIRRVTHIKGRESMQKIKDTAMLWGALLMILFSIFRHGVLGMDWEIYFFSGLSGSLGGMIVVDMLGAHPLGLFKNLEKKQPLT